ncbi:hypothetical protein BJX76DRAFT_367481 [Aspergillus varians]
MSHAARIITRDGFSYEYGRFYTTNGRVERVDGASLQRMFLPKLTPEGNKQLRDHMDFVRSQLQHYTEQMHREWVDTLTPEYLAGYPDWAMDAYFLQAGDRQPDRTRTTTVVELPFPLSSQYRVGQMQEAAGKVVGLYHEMGRGPKTQTIFMGWNEAAVKAAARGHAAKEKKKLQAEEREREDERAEMHKEYLQASKKKRGRNAKPSPVGSYIVDCEDIESNWPDLAQDLSLDVHDTDEPGVFKACFDFGVLEGVIILGTGHAVLRQYCSRADRKGGGYSFGGCYDEEEDGRNEEEDERPKVGSKRKAPAPQRVSGRPKNVKAGDSPSHTYRVKLRCRETEGPIHSQASDGTIKFKDSSLSSFVGEASLPCVGNAVSFTAQKVSDVPSSQQSEWADYSEER